MYKMKITTITVYWTTKIRSKYLVLGPGAQKLFGYRVAHHGYLLMFCPGYMNFFVFINYLLYL